MGRLVIDTHNKLLFKQIPPCSTKYRQLEFPLLCSFFKESLITPNYLMVVIANGPSLNKMFMKLTKIRGHLQKQGAINENEGADELLFGVLDQN